MLCTLTLLPLCAAIPQQPDAQQPQFHPPVRMRAGEDYVKVESPGYACPAWADVDGDGREDLVVGQFRDGKMRVYRNLGEGRLAAGEWLEAEGNVAQVPGVW